LKTINVIILTLALLIITIFSVGGGHGTFVIAKIIFPFSMLLAYVFNKIGIISMLLAILQIPIYSYLYKSKPNGKYFIIGLHILAIILCFILKSETFS
jgi:hypothetical protein